LIDVEAPNDYIARLISSVQDTAPIDDLIVQTLKRGRLKLLEQILHSRAQAGSTDAATNNGIVLLAVLSSRNGEFRLRANQYYDPSFVGDILATRDAHLASVASAKGNCDDELIESTGKLIIVFPSQVTQDGHTHGRPSLIYHSHLSLRTRTSYC